MLELFRDPTWPVLGLIVPLLLVVAVYYYRKRRNERKMVRGLLTFLWSRRVLYSSLYQEHPVAALESIRGIQLKLRDALERLPDESKAFRPVREMHEACLGFLTRIEPSTRVEPLPMPGETELLSDKWVSGIYRQTFGEDLIRLRSAFNPHMDELYEAYGIEKPPPRVIRRAHAVPPP